MKTNKKIFVDTNIWLHSIIHTDKQKHEISKSLLSDVTHEAYCNSQIINEVSYNLLKFQLLSEEKVRGLIQNLYEKYIVLSISKAVLLNASEIREANSLDLWDSILVASAQIGECECIYSDEIVGIQNFDIPIINPYK